LVKDRDECGGVRVRTTEFPATIIILYILVPLNTCPLLFQRFFIPPRLKIQTRIYFITKTRNDSSVALELDNFREASVTS
jgi:hypothetical protein